MKLLSCFLLVSMMFYCAEGKLTEYRGSTPAHLDVRTFLGISLTDTIDFIRWKLILNQETYEVSCKYGLSKPSTNDFINVNEVLFSGRLTKEGNYFRMHHEGRLFSLLELNENLLYLLDKHNNLLIGTGGYSYTLNRNEPVNTDRLNIQVKQSSPEHITAYQGRTPCQELSKLLALNKSSACDKLKWYIILFSDSLTRKPLYYLQGGIGYRQETMNRGKWEIVRQNGRVIYKLNPEKKNHATFLLKAEENILLFTDPKGRLLVGNENFSYVLNRTEVKKSR